MKHNLLGAVVVSLFLSTAVFAQDDTTTSSRDESTAEQRDRQDRGERGRDGDKRRGVELSRRALRTIDTDQDGKVSEAEYLAHGQQRFDALDLNGDDFVTSEEAKQASEQLRKNQNEARSALNDRKERSTDDASVPETD